MVLQELFWEANTVPTGKYINIYTHSKSLKVNPLQIIHSQNQYVQYVQKKYNASYPCNVKFCSNHIWKVILQS